METLETKIYNLVKEQFGKMRMSKTESNQARLSNICQNVISNEWGFSNNVTWDFVNKYVEEFIPEHLD